MGILEELREKLAAKTKAVREAMDGGLSDESKKLMAEARDLGAQITAETELRGLNDLVEKTTPKAPELVASAGWAGVRSAFKAAFENRGGAVDLSGVERRAITSNGAGVNTAPGVIRAMVDGGKLRSKVSLFLGKNAQTVVQVFAPHMAVPVGSVPGATGTASDSTAVLAGDGLTLKPWYSTLAISMGALMSTDIEAELPAIFQEAFGAAIDKGICVGAGSGSDMLGVFIASASGVATAQDLTATGTAAAPVWADYIGMALELLALGGKPEDLAIIVHPAVFKSALGVTTNDPEKIEFMTRGTILEIPVILSSYALTTLTSGSYVAVGGNFKHFALAIAMEIGVDQIKTVGSDNVTFQALMYMQGKPLISSSFRRLKTG